MHRSRALTIALLIALAACRGAASGSQTGAPVPSATPSAAGGMAKSSLPTDAHASGTAGAPGVAAPGTGNSVPGPTNPSAGASPGVGGANAGAGGMGLSMLTAPDPSTVTLKMDDFTAQPGAEVFMCQDFDNPFGGLDVAVGRTESTMTPGSHHMQVFYGATTAQRTLQTCANPNEFRPMLHIAVQPHQLEAYPQGMAAKLKGSTGLRMQLHYINSDTAPRTVSVTLTLTKVDPASVQKWVAQIHYNRVAMTIPQGAGQQVTTSCSIPSTFGPIGLVSAVSHMHKRGVHFVATSSTGSMLADVTQWDGAPPIHYDPPVMLSPGDRISWTCTYNNDTGRTLSYGDSAESSEMCIYIARFFSSPNGDDIECETPSANGNGVSTSRIPGM
jgi:copper type II ascorbate-dependent monooxygenase-like protein